MLMESQSIQNLMCIIDNITKKSKGLRIRNAMTVMAPITAVLESLNNLSSSTIESEVSFDNPIEIIEIMNPRL